MISEQPQGTVIRVGKVVKVHIEDHSLDIVMLDNGARYHHVPALSASAGTRAGRVDLPEPDTKDANNPWSQAMTETFDILAVVAMTSLMPVCLGYLYQPVNQLAMPKETKNLRIDRHASDVYTATDDSANTATHHPYGAYFSIGASGTPKIEKAGDFDRQWKLTRNKRNVAQFTQYTPNKQFEDSDPTSDGKVIGYGRSDVKPTQIFLETKLELRQSSPENSLWIITDEWIAKTDMNINDGVVSTAHHYRQEPHSFDKNEATVYLTMEGIAKIEATRDINLIAEKNINATAGLENIKVTAGNHITAKAQAIFLN